MSVTAIANAGCALPPWPLKRIAPLYSPRVSCALWRLATQSAAFAWSVTVTTISGSEPVNDETSSDPVSAGRGHRAADGDDPAEPRLDVGGVGLLVARHGGDDLVERLVELCVDRRLVLEARERRQELGDLLALVARQVEAVLAVLDDVVGHVADGDRDLGAAGGQCEHRRGRDEDDRDADEGDRPADAGRPAGPAGDRVAAVALDGLGRCGGAGLGRLDRRQRRIGGRRPGGGRRRRFGRRARVDRVGHLGILVTVGRSWRRARPVGRPRKAVSSFSGARRAA